jgi:hypothetical protein
LMYYAIVWSTAQGITTVRDPVFCTHATLGIVEKLSYVLLFVVGGPSGFVEHWESIMFGFYTWTLLWIGRFWENLVPDFRYFYFVHHSMTLLMVGI